MDVAKKIVILARTAGYPVSLEDVEVEPFIPGGFRELTDVGADEFMAKAKIFDEEIAAKFSEAKAQGKTLRYVASLSTESGKTVVKLGLREEALNSQLGSLEGNVNKVVIYTSKYELPHVISAPGSGTQLTAANVRADLSDLLGK
jgi:homoserine dehydrogenase